MARSDSDLYSELKSGLASSDSELRKHWAQEIVDQDISLESLISLFHLGNKTSQRFMWMLDDVSRLAPSKLAPLMPLLFELRDKMPFPGMPRSVAKWLFSTKVPFEVEREAIEQLLEWVGDEQASIACKSFAAKTLLDLVLHRRVDRPRLIQVVESQVHHPNRAFRSRMVKILDRIRSLKFVESDRMNPDLLQ